MIDEWPSLVFRPEAKRDDRADGRAPFIFVAGIAILLVGASAVAMVFV